MSRENASQISEAERLERMEAMFTAERGILAEDYEHFAGLVKPPGGANPRSKAARKSLTLNARPGPRPS